MSNQTSPALNIALWVVQSLLALMFLGAGAAKLFAPLDPEAMTFLTRYPEWLAYFIGVVEVLGAVGLILPTALRIAPSLTGWAGVGIATIMVLATLDHIVAGEPFVHTIVIGLVAGFVAWGRLSAAPIAPRG